MQKMGQEFAGARRKQQYAATLVKGFDCVFNHLRERKYFRFWTAEAQIVQI